MILQNTIQKKQKGKLHIFFYRIRMRAACYFTREEERLNHTALAHMLGIDFL